MANTISTLFKATGLVLLFQDLFSAEERLLLLSMANKDGDDGQGE